MGGGGGGEDEEEEEREQKFYENESCTHYPDWDLYTLLQQNGKKSIPTVAFVAIHAVRVKESLKDGFLFSKSFRDSKTKEFRKKYPSVSHGRPRFFYFETYCTLLPDLKKAGWIEKHATAQSPGHKCV